MADNNGGQETLRENAVHYYGTAASNQHRRFSALLVLLRVVTLSFSLASVVIMASNNHHLSGTNGGRIKWYNFDEYRYLFAVNAIICIYSLAETGLGIWTLSRGTMLMPDSVAFWFDYGHDQGFAYLLVSASSASTSLAQNLQNGKIILLSKGTGSTVSIFCTQAEIAIAMSFAAFLFVAASALLSGFRLARWLMSS